MEEKAAHAKIGKGEDYRTHTVEEIKEEIERQTKVGLPVYVVQWGGEIAPLPKLPD